MPPVPASRRSAPPPPSNNPSSSTASYADVSELDKYQLDSNIGKGSFGVISKVIRKSDGKEFAMKQIDYGKMTDKDKKQIMAEVAILESLKHRNIVQLVQKIRDRQKERIYIVMEYCTSGDLGTLIRRAQRTNTPMNEDKIWNIFLQITLALNHCHWPSERSSEQNGRLGSRLSGAGEEGASGRCQVLHRDLKPENVFMSEDFVKLGDFGLSKDMGSASFTSTYVGTPLYMPPEILAENRYDTKSDIWSLGCLVFEMCVLSSPFSAATTQPQLIGLVRSGKLPEIPVQYSRSLRGIIRTMLSLDPAKRPTTKDLLELPEMKMHKKVFTLQNQTLLLLSRKEEVKRLEDTLRARSAQLDARERSLVMREQACLVREKEADETNAKMAAAAEQMRAQWDQLNKERHEYETAYREAEARLGQRQAEIDNARAALQPVRPPLEERATLPMASSSRPRAILAGYENTPTKIPLPSAAPVSLRKHASKSLGNLAAIARGDIGPSQHPSFPGNIYDNPIDVDRTPAKQLAGQGGSSIRSRKDRFGRNSIGSPSDLKKRYSGIYGAEDVTMASAYGCRFGSPAVAGTSTGSFDLAGADNSAMASPFMLKAGISRPRKSSLVGPGGISGTRQQTGAGGGTQTPAEVLAQQRQQIQAPAPISAPTSIGSGASSSSYVPSAGAGSTHVHAMATPAKWTPDDPDLPSPFLRRMTTAPATIPTVPSVPASTAPLYPTIPFTSTEDRHSAPAYTARTQDRPERERERASERAALGAIPLPSQIGHTSSAASSVESKSEKATSTYEIGAGIAKMGIRHKGSAPPAPGITMGGIPRSKSGNLHQYATMRAAREDGARVVGGTAGTGDVRREGQGTGSLGYARNRAIGRG